MPAQTPSRGDHRGDASRGTLPRSRSSTKPFGGGRGSSARRGPTNIATTTEELIAYDRLGARDKELLEKSQVVLGLSKLYELEMGDKGSAKRLSDTISRGLNSAQKDENMNTISSKIQLAQKRLLDKEHRNQEIPYSLGHSHAGAGERQENTVRKVRDLI